MSSPISCIVANLFMKYFEQKVLSTAPTPGFGRGMWMAPLSSRRKSTNSISYNMLTGLTLPFNLQWRTTGGWCHPILYTIVKPEADGNLSITMYRKPTHTDQYPQWDSHHHLSAKFSVIQTLTHSTQTLCNNPGLLHKEKTHLWKALIQCKYPKWALNRVQKRLNKPYKEVTDGPNNQGTAGAKLTTYEVETKGHIVIPYTQGLCESIKKICGRYGIQTYFKGSNTTQNLLVSPKDKEPMVSKSGAIYWLQCGDISCDDEYIEETFLDLWRKVQRASEGPLTNSSSQQLYRPSPSLNNFQIIGMEGHGLARNIKE